MKIIEKKEKQNEKWLEGDVIKYWNECDSDATYAMIASIAKHFVLVDLNGFTGISTIGTHYLSEEDMDDFIYDLKCAAYNLDELRTRMISKWDHVEKVPFYGVVGKPEEN